MTKNYFLPLCFLLLVFGYLESKAQSTNPAPYCYPTATSMTGGTCTGIGGPNGYGFGLQSVKLKTLSQTGSCYGSSNTDVYRYWGATTNLYSGTSNGMTVMTPYNASGYNVSAGVWIDFNQNGSFEGVELLGADMAKNNIHGTGGLIHSFSFVVPCSAAAGKTRMRVRSQYNVKVSAADTCSCPGGYGETWDFDVTIVQPNSVSAGFNCPTQAFVKTVVKFGNINHEGYTEHAWDIDNNGTWDQIGQIPDYSTKSSTWATAGTKCVKLRSTNCFGTDSVLKCLSIINPTVKPVVAFTKASPCERVVEVYGGINLIDTSGQGPYSWTWNIYDSLTFKNDPFDPFSGESNGYVVFDNGTTRNSQSPNVSFYREGLYSVELIATNAIGTSKMTKKSYIKVISPTFYALGFGAYGPQIDNRVVSDYGFIVDDGGPNTNYGNNQGKGTKSFLIINPPATRPVTLKFEQLRLKDTKDSIKIYDDDKMDNSKLIAVLTSANNGTYPSYTSTLNKMYFYFSSDASGVDSGYQVQYTNTGVYKYSKFQHISLGHNILFVNGKSVFYNENQNEFGFNYTKEWSVNDTVQTAYDNQDTFKYKFKYAGSQKVCLEMKTCDTSFKACENIVFESGLMGVVYKDNNSNCNYNTGDKPMPNIHMKLFDSTSNSWSHHFTNSLGEYNFNKGAGTYKAAIDASGMPFRTICPTPGVDSFFRLSSTTTFREINFDIGCKTGHDIGTQSIWTNGIVFPGRQHELRVSAGDMNKWFGLNCNSGLSGSVVVTVSGNVSYLNPASGALSPSSVSGKVFTYSISDFSQINNNTDFGLVFKTDTFAKSGDTISVHVRVTPLSGDNDTTNNDFRYRYRVRNSYDPNMKEVYPDELTAGFKDWLTYTIHFQNTGNAPAFDIRLADTLDKLLDPETFQLLNYSHTVATTLSGKVLSFKFKDIMLPDSNSDEKGSHGFVQFRIKPKTALLKGEKIENTAFIYFDYNEPVVTNTVSNEIFPICVLIPDVNLAKWLNNKYPGSMRKGNLLDTSRAEIKNETVVDVNGKNISNLFGIQFFTSLKTLDCSGNSLVSLPALSSSLVELNCAYNDLVSIPALPASLQSVVCGFNKLDKLPLLPVNLTILDCRNNQLIDLPVLPVSLDKLYCGNNKISCFEKFSTRLSALDVAGNNNKCLPNYINVMDVTTKKMPLCIKGDIINNPDNCPTTLPSLVLIPDAVFATWLNGLFPSCMVNGNWMDTACMDIKKATSVNVAGKSIADLFGIQYFTSLKTLNCSGNNLTALPELQGTLTHLNCSENNIKNLPELPNTLQALLCENNSLTSLPTLPSGVDYLNCSDNAIDSLPALPSVLKTLYCGYNLLVTLPVLPSGLSILNCESNKLSDLPNLPISLSQLMCDSNKIVCFDKFSDNISRIDISGNKNKCLPNYIDAMDVPTKATPLCIKGDIVNNPDNCLSTLQISVKHITSEYDINVYPNPGSGIYNISLPENLKNSDVKAEVYNVLGELVATSTINNGNAQIDLSGYVNGVYMLKLVGPEILITKSLVKE